MKTAGLLSDTEYKNAVNQADIRSKRNAIVQGLLGYGLGIYLVVNGLSFDESYLLELPSPKFQPKQNTTNIFKDEMIPLYSYTNTKKNNSIHWNFSIFKLNF